MRHLHKARFLRAPLSDVKKWWKMMPAARSHIYKTIPLKFSGSQSKISDKTIWFLHDRAKALSIKNFHSQNVCVALKKIERKNAEGLVTLFDYSWEEPGSLAEFTEALILHHCDVIIMASGPYGDNYAQTHQHLQMGFSDLDTNVKDGYKYKFSLTLLISTFSLVKYLIKLFQSLISSFTEFLQFE